MKNKFAFLLVAMLCASAMTQTVLAADEHDQVYEIAYGTPTIDLELDDCYMASTEVTFNTEMGDANGSVYMTWDEEKLYFYIEIDDKTPCTKTAATVGDHNTDSIDIMTSLYGFDPDAETIPAKVAEDIGDAQFRVFRTNQIHENKDLTTNGLASEAHGGFGVYIADNGGSYILHNGGTDAGYIFEGYFVWGEELQSSDKPIEAGSIIGLGFQINDDANDDGTRENKIYSLNADASKSMTTERATLGAFELLEKVEVVETVEAAETTETADAAAEVATAPKTFDASILCAIGSAIAAFGFTKTKKR